MKKVLLALSFLLVLGGCARVSEALSAATTVTVPDKSVYVAVNTFDALKVTATNYLSLPKCGKFPCYSMEAKAKIVPAVRAGTIARNNIERFRREHPGELGLKGDYDALTGSVDTLKAIYALYNVEETAK